MANGNILKQLRDMADREKISTPQALPLLMAAVADIYEEMKAGSDWRKQADERLDALEDKSSKDIAVIGAIGVIVGSLIAVLGEYLIAAI